jgi:hypothetical protein
MWRILPTQQGTQQDRQESQWKYNVKLRRVRENIVALEKQQILHICVRVCVCVCVRARELACV